MNVELPSKLARVRHPKRVKVLYGGRGGGKTVGVADLLLLRAIQGPARIFCGREYLNSIAESVHGVLSAEIRRLGLAALYQIQNNQILGPGGSKFFFGGLARNPDSIKSMHDVDIAWIEEAATVSEESMDILEPTIRRPGSEIWYTLNPKDRFGAVYAKYIAPHLDTLEDVGCYEDDSLLVVKINLEDNPFAPQELIDSSARMRAENYPKWLHIWGGEPWADYEDSLIKPEWVEAAVDAHLKLGWAPEGPRVLGFDPADNGEDAKAAALRHGSLVEHLSHWRDGELPEAIDKAFSLCDLWRAHCLVYDADGLGRAVKVGLDKRLEGRPHLQVHGYGGGSGVDQPTEIYMGHRSNKDTFRNARAQYWHYLADRFNATYNAVAKGRYTDPEKLISLSGDLPGLDLLKSELTQMQRKAGDTSYLQLESKADMKKRGFRSPNLADAVVMAFANPAPRPKALELNFQSEFG